MKHTTGSLARMSDFEVNKALAELLGVLLTPPANTKTEIVGDKLFYRDALGDYYECHPSYCDSLDDIMPIVFEHGISLVRSRKGWIAILGAENLVDGKDCLAPYAASTTNPLRAAVCCLILVLQGGEK